MTEKKDQERVGRVKKGKTKVASFFEQASNEDQILLGDEQNPQVKNAPKRKTRKSNTTSSSEQNKAALEKEPEKAINTTNVADATENPSEILKTKNKVATKSRRTTSTRAKKEESIEKKEQAPKRKPGRPAKKNTEKPVLQLVESKKLALQEDEKIAIASEEKLALEKNENIAIGSEEKLAILGSDKKAIAERKNIAITHQSKKALEEHKIEPKNLPNTIIEDDLKSEVFDAGKEVDIKKTGSLRASGSRKVSQVSSGSKKNTSKNNLNSEPEQVKATVALDLDSMGIKTDSQKPVENQNSQKVNFISGDFGVSAYGGSQSLGEYGEQAALGVFGLIDEAPSIEALLPLMPTISEESIVEVEPENPIVFEKEERNTKIPPKRTKKSKRNNLVEPSVQGAEAPIAEGGELSILEAEQNVKKQTPKVKKDKAEHMHRVLYVSSVPDEQVEVVITENGVVSEYFVEMAHQAKIRGNIYKGVINNVDNNLQAAFVNFGSGKNGFLQIDEVHPEYWLTHHTEGGKFPPIQKVLKVGQEVLVQVVKEPGGTKGAFLTTWLSLAGRFIVLTPGQEQIGVSRKVEDATERARLRELISDIKPGENMGVIIRTASEGASKSNIQSDLKFLKRSWKEIQKKVSQQEAPSLIYREADLASRAVRDYLTEDIDEIWVDSEELREALQGLVKVIFPKRKSMLNLHKDSRHSLWERFNILHQLEEVTKREVVLPSGGRLVFDQTEALMAIDINSGKTHSKSNFESMVFRTNMEAAEAIARHLRLRDIGGQIVIDFIEMRDRNHCREVEKCMVNSMKRDKARHDVGKLSSFGLLELVRQRTGTSAISMSSEPCPHCRGIGFRRNLEWQAQGVLRDIKSKLAGKTINNVFVHHVEQDIAFYILNKKRDRLQELENLYKVKIEILSK